MRARVLESDDPQVGFAPENLVEEAENDIQAQRKTFAAGELPRRLVAADFRRVPQYSFDVLIVGSGAAGCTAAFSAAQEGASVAVLSKGVLNESNTLYAQGGMAAVLAKGDSFEEHAADTMRLGCGLSEEAVVREVVGEGKRAVELLASLGAEFDKDQHGELDLTREGGHAHPRIIHSKGDTTGMEIQRALTGSLLDHPNIASFPNGFVVDLLFDAEGVFGALVCNDKNEIVAFCAPQVVLATGGAGQLFRETTNPAIATGDGVALAFRAGAAVQDAEFFQFHPTCLYIAGAARVLISEIVRGAGGILRDRDGHRFMREFHADAELAPRDVVSRAVFRRMVKTGDTNVYLDLSEVSGDPHQLFPRISRICRFFGFDIAKDPIPVRPGAHYMIGGVQVRPDGSSTIPGLWAVGECASTGLHGANRMGSNSLLEAVVLGTRTGRAAALADGNAALHSRLYSSIQPSEGQERAGFDVNIQDVTYSLKSLMWRQMGVERNAADLADALQKVELWSRAVGFLAPPNPRTWELLNMLLIARLSIHSATAREESRGVHYRTDFPEQVEAWRAHTVLTPDVGGGNAVSLQGMRISAVPVTQTHKPGQALPASQHSQSSSTAAAQ